MRLTIILVILIAYPLFPTSLYSDDVETNLNPQQLKNDDHYSENHDLNTPSINHSFDRYMKDTFALSQLTAGLAQISDESIIYSHISRLDRISTELIALLKPGSIEFDEFSTVGALTKIQAYYQETLFKLYVLSPFIPSLLNEDQSKVQYYIDYIHEITNQIQGNVQQMIAINQHINPQGTMPFTPKTPQQLSFALEQQINSALMGLINSDTIPSNTGMPYSSMATPTNADFFNMPDNQSMQAMPNSTASPIQMMQYMPSF